MSTKVSAETPASIFMVSLEKKAAVSSESLAPLYQITRSDVKKAVGLILSFNAIRSSKLMFLYILSVVVFSSVCQSSRLEILASIFMYTRHSFISAHHHTFCLSKHNTKPTILWISDKRLLFYL